MRSRIIMHMALNVAQFLKNQFDSLEFAICG